MHALAARRGYVWRLGGIVSGSRARVAPEMSKLAPITLGRDEFTCGLS